MIDADADPDRSDNTIERYNRIRVVVVVAVAVAADRSTAVVVAAAVLHSGNAHVCAGLLGVYFQFGNHSFAQLPFRQTLQNHMTQNL